MFLSYICHTSLKKIIDCSHFLIKNQQNFRKYNAYVDKTEMTFSISINGFGKADVVELPMFVVDDC